MTPFTWKTIAYGELVSSWNNFTLKVEQLKNKNWWWSVNKGREVIDDAWNYTTGYKTEREAKLFCESVARKLMEENQ